MPDRVEIGEGSSSIVPLLNNVVRLGEGYGVLNGGGVTVGSSSTDIEVTVDGGEVRVAGQPQEFSTSTETLFDGDPNDPRKDLVYVDFNGEVKSLQGEPRGYVPEGKDGVFSWSPAPPAASTIDGVPLAEVEVPAGATSSDDLPSDAINDRRIIDVGGFGYVPALDADPVQEDLSQTRLWRNTTDGAFRAYAEDADEIVTFTTTVETSFGAPAIQTLETFDSDISANWDGDTSALAYGTPAIEGSASAEFDADPAPSVYSIPSTGGLDDYPESGDTVGLGVYATSVGNDSSDYASLTFAKDRDDDHTGYQVVNQRQASELRLVRTDPDGSTTQLGSTAFDDSVSTWYIIEADYDGGGDGVHPVRVWSVDTGTDPPTRDTKLAEITSPTQDQTYRGRGVGVAVEDPGRVDYLYLES